jgi:hypothetical protein
MRRMRPARAAVTLAFAGGALALATADASAQNRRDGQWLAVGLGGGFDQVACGVCAGNPEPGIAGFVRFGGTIGERLLLGGEFNGWTRDADDTRQLLGSLSAIALFYAGPEARFHVKAGLGAVGYRASEDGDALSALSFGVTSGIGYDLPINETLSLTPFASLTLAPFTKLHFNGDLAESGVTLGLLQGGLSLTWH